MYRMCCWYIITGNVILCYFFFCCTICTLLKYTCYMCNRQGAHKSHRISSSLCSHDNALLYLYWYLHFMLIWPWCILYYVWWEAIKLFWNLNEWIEWSISDYMEEGIHHSWKPKPLFTKRQDLWPPDLAYSRTCEIVCWNYQMVLQLGWLLDIMCF